MQKSELSIVQKYLYGAPESGASLIKISEKHQIQGRDQYRTFVLIIGDVILGTKSFNEASTEFVTTLKLDLTTAAALANDVAQFLAPLSDPNWQAPAEFLAELAEEELVEQPSESTTASTTTPIQNDLLVKPPIPHLHTMASDGGGPSVFPSSHTSVHTPTNPFSAGQTPSYTPIPPQIGYDSVETPTHKSSQDSVFGA